MAKQREMGQGTNQAPANAGRGSARPTRAAGDGTTLPPVEPPSGLAFYLVPADESATLPPRLDRQLGYFGRNRFVGFYYEPRGEEVMWDDGRSYGFATGGWMIFSDLVSPLARRLGVDVGGSESAASHLLVVDRTSGRAFFAPRAAARQFLARRGEEPHAGPAAPRLPG